MNHFHNNIVNLTMILESHYSLTTENGTHIKSHQVYANEVSVLVQNQSLTQTHSIHLKHSASRHNIITCTWITKNCSSILYFAFWIQVVSGLSDDSYIPSLHTDNLHDQLTDHKYFTLQMIYTIIYSTYYSKNVTVGLLLMPTYNLQN